MTFSEFMNQTWVGVVLGVILLVSLALFLYGLHGDLERIRSGKL